MEAKIGNVLYPVEDVEKAIAFYNVAVGLPLKFQDGARFAALDGGSTTFALAGAEEQVAGRAAAVSFKVPDVAAAVREIEAAGGVVVAPAAEGPHEVRAVVQDPWGNAFIVYGPKK
ncbi:VOC family protein [Nocardia sp. CA2R105]|uniref:VOC family protein n=1 Tax=Nocardia coffeae TaxID=2873381 RepID=UPI001CA6AFD8|nr:VOC family protein [Nocardia coffeae]MBY8856882.1 VOC family protein [Nocardia coffeae]